MKVLVTGGAGYIGSHAILALLQKNHEAIIFDNLSTGNEDLANRLNSTPLIKGDLLRPSDLKRVFQENNIDSVMHFAALASVPESVANPLKYYRNNVQGTLNLLSAMHDFGVKNFIFSSTAAVYGNPEKQPLSEDNACLPINPYGQSKMMVEKILKDLKDQGALEYISLRYFNAAGADPENRIGERHAQEDHLIPKILLAICEAQKNGENPRVSIYGKNYATSDGTCIRDYIHVMDIAHAHILALEKLSSDQKISSVYNLGNQKGYSVLEIISAIEKITKIPLEKSFDEPRPGDPAILIASHDKIKKELHWKPRFSNIETIIKTAWEWTQKDNSPSIKKQ